MVLCLLMASRISEIIIILYENLKKKVKKKLGVKYCLATTSGTMAQYIAMKALGIKSGDEVITQAFTFVATVEINNESGAKPVITNIDETYGMCLHDLKKINKKTKLIIPVPMLGNQIKINEINYIAKKKKILVLEDHVRHLVQRYMENMLELIVILEFTV